MFIPSPRHPVIEMLSDIEAMNAARINSSTHTVLGPEAGASLERLQAIHARRARRWSLQRYSRGEHQ